MAEEELAANFAELVDEVQQLAGIVNQLLTRIEELEFYRDTGAKGKQCPVCRQIMPLTSNGRLITHSSERQAKCFMSGDSPNG